jgi:vacuolar-type H+-ATPase subunit I/STV1
MALTSPLDKIPKIPPQLTSLIVDAIVAYINSIIENLMITLAEAVKLPDNIQCDDPRIKKIEEQLTKIQELILKLQEFIPYIEKALSAIQTAVTLANSIKAIQLLNPVTAIPVLAAELVLAQNLTIANALTSVEQLKTIPQKLNLNIDLIASKLGEIYGRLGQACTDKEYEVAPEVKKSIDQMQQFDINVNPDGGLPSEFYREVNVSTDDIEQRLELIKQLIDSQQDLFESLQEAPAQSFNGTTPPEVDLGKSGDYFIDTAAKKIYGPKTINGWPEGVNY